MYCKPGQGSSNIKITSSQFKEIMQMSQIVKELEQGDVKVLWVIIISANILRANKNYIIY